MAGQAVSALIPTEKRGAAGITTAAPRIAGQWGRGITGCQNDSQPKRSFQPDRDFFLIFS
jgi:hypothetical protein